MAVMKPINMEPRGPHPAGSYEVWVSYRLCPAFSSQLLVFVGGAVLRLHDSFSDVAFDAGAQGVLLQSHALFHDRAWQFVHPVAPAVSMGGEHSPFTSLRLSAVSFRSPAPPFPLPFLSFSLLLFGLRLKTTRAVPCGWVSPPSSTLR